MLGAPGPRHGRGSLLVVSVLLLAAVLAAAAWLLLRRPAREPRPMSAPSTRRATASATPAPAAPAAAAGTLQVDAVEPGALVAVDGEPLGPAPQTRQLAPGPHLVRVTKEGREPWEREVQLIP